MFVLFIFFFITKECHIGNRVLRNRVCSKGENWENIEHPVVNVGFLGVSGYG